MSVQALVPGCGKWKPSIAKDQSQLSVIRDQLSGHGNHQRAWNGGWIGDWFPGVRRKLTAILFLLLGLLHFGREHSVFAQPRQVKLVLPRSQRFPMLA